MYVSVYECVGVYGSGVWVCRLPAESGPQQARVVVVGTRVATVRLHERSAVVRSTYNDILDLITVMQL